MNDAGGMVPKPVEGVAHAHKWFGFAFGPRFYVILLMGLAWLGPAFVVNPRFVYAMLAWDALALLVWLLDLILLPKPDSFLIRRSWLSPAALSVPSEVRITLVNRSNHLVHALIIDNIPFQLRRELPQIEISAGARKEAEAGYSVEPLVRGEALINHLYLRYRSPLRIAERWARASLEQRVLVYPNLEEAKRYTIYLLRSRQIEMEKRYSRIRGHGREFESLREYREGDEYRDICWTAAARRGKLVTRIYQVERSQTIWIVLDSGRLMRARIDQLSKLDYAVNAALSLAQVALYSGDRVGLMAYGRGIRQYVPAAKGSLHLRGMIEKLAMVKEETGEADHLQAASRLFSDQKNRSLVVWLTDLAETAMAPEVIEAASLMMSRHLVLFLVIGQPDLAALAAQKPKNVELMYETAAAHETIHRRELLLARLRERGALALEVDSQSVSPVLINSYLQIKEKDQL